MEKNKKGFLLYAFGHRDLDYGKLAVCCALSIKTNLKNNHTTVVMDQETKNWLTVTVSQDILEIAFDKIIISKEKFRSGKRRHFDSPWVSFKAEFNNQNRVLSYQYSPYDETILLDTDYIVMNNNFDDIWGSNEDLLMNKKAVDLQGNKFDSIDDQRLSSHGIPLYWATVVYFKKSQLAEIFFNLVNYIREEYNFFQFLYGFKAGFYRNDYSFSIAAHIINGYIKDGFQSFPEDSIITSYQKDTIAKIISSKEIIFASHNVNEPWKSTLVNMKDMNVHVMNKKELLRISETFIESCLEQL